ncbi:MAG: type VII secretion protein EccB, partial [Actinomycetota bacterium]|nr:type VII secretion protein EccB [Actinomycetota bacterium]
SGHRFGVRRMEHALVRGDTRMIDDPLRAQSISLLAGALLAAVIVTVCAVLAVVRPAGELGDAQVVLLRDSGAMFVRIGERMHPVLNLASARLIAGAPAEPRIVAPEALERAQRGPVVGIPGAPQQISPPLAVEQSRWTVCDDTGSGVSTAIAGPIADGGMADGHALLVTPRGESAATTYLIADSRRARVDLRHPAVVRALQLEGVVPQQVSPVLLAAVPEAPAIAAPRIPAGPSVLPGFAAGTVVRLPGTAPAGEAELFVLLPDGIQRIGKVAADLIRYTDARAGGQIPTVSADRIGVLPVVDTLPVGTFPQRPGVTAESVVCAHWNPSSAAHTVVLTGSAAPMVHPAVTLAQADGGGPALDAVSLPAGRSMFARSVGLTGAGRDTGSSFLVTADGVRFGVADGDTASALGLTAAPVPAPWPVLAALPGGPELSRAAASVARDGIGGPPAMP